MEHEGFMRMALELARKGIGWVEPNPAVGCVIVRDGQVIGSGFHERFGGPHAEVNALADCRQKGGDARGASMYVTLEPCCHTGKTPPCTNTVIEAGISRVIIAEGDPCPHVAGGGIEQLKKAGIEVELGLCRKEARTLNAPFYKHAETGRPWVIAKWAQSADGFLASTRQRWVSGEASRKDVHNLRRRCQAILVGIDTVIADDPLLTVRLEDLDWQRQPMRVILDSNLRMPDDRKILDTAGAETLIVVTSHTLRKESERINGLALRGAQMLAVNEIGGKCDLERVLSELGRRGVQQLLVEGGEKILTQFIAVDLIDEVRVYTSPENFGEDGYVPVSDEMRRIFDAKKLKYIREEPFGKDTCLSGLVHGALEG